MERILNIALVGHVANGKTTLVNALTGVNTKRSSTEKKTGKTIKLGYANCILWQCNKCSQVYSNGQNDSIPECCSIPMERKATISFVDAPGHHSYVHTMVKGVTVVDGALLVTDVKKEPMQLQTMEHLAILSILNIRNIIVIQNKADLVSPDRCLEHYNLLKQELLGTAAENSPVVPVSAQSGINIDVLRRLLLEMALGLLGQSETSTSGIFQIIRSFDINKPGITLENLKGGVLGGTVVGSAQYAVGDLVEIRPGRINVDGTCKPLETEILSIFAESKECKCTTLGGLYGLGTKLDPYLTMADKLSGNLLGKAGELPDVVSEIEMYITSVCLNLDDKVKLRVRPKNMYRLIIGNLVVDAEATESKKTKCVVMKLAKPICTVEGKCLIYNVGSDGDKLIAFGTFGNVEKYKIPIELIQPDYAELIKDLKIHEKSIVKIPIVKLGRENRNILWINIDAFSKAVYRTPAEIGIYLAQETLLNISICANGLRIYKSNINSAKIESIMKKYIKEFVLCGQCKSLNTSNGVCADCKAVTRDL